MKIAFPIKMHNLNAGIIKEGVIITRVRTSRPPSPFFSERGLYHKQWGEKRESGMVGRQETEGLHGP